MSRTDKNLTEMQWKVREAAESDLQTFIELVAPYNVIGGVHAELCAWWTRQEALSHQLVLLPRDHGKSRYMAFRVAWYITKNPDTRILYISSTATLAKKQLGFIKQILDSKIYRKYWPEMLHPEVGKRSKWTEDEIEVDHPLRKSEAIRDPTIMTAGLERSITGLHFDVACLDDIVVKENTYTEEGRAKVEAQYSLLASIESGDALEWVVGTRYHPLDLYGHQQEMHYDVYDEEGHLIDSSPLYEVFEREVEDEGDGTGEFLWPRQMRKDGKWFGFNANILAKKRAAYVDKTQFRAQYYNNPNAGETGGINRDCFQYYNPEALKYRRGRWTYEGEFLNIVAAVDFSYSNTKKSDYTAIVVLGIDSNRRYYVLEVDRFKTDSIRTYYEHILSLYKKWEFRKLVAETVAAQQAIVRELKQEYLIPNGIMIGIEEVKPTRMQGAKEDRMTAILEPIYMNGAVYHYRGGNCQVLEDELVMQFPPHDDCKDALSNAVDNIAAPSNMRNRDKGPGGGPNVLSHPRFGGVMKNAS